MCRSADIKHIRSQPLPAAIFYLRLGLAALFFLVAVPLQAQRNVEDIYRLASQVSFPVVSGWRAFKGQVTAGRDPELDDSGWEKFDYQEVLGTEQCWFRVELELPEKIALQPVSSSAVWLLLEVQNHGTAYLDGKKVKSLVPGKNRFLIKRKAEPGARVKVAVHLTGKNQKIIFRQAVLELASWRQAIEVARQLHLTIFTAVRILGTDIRQRGLMIEEDQGLDRSTVSAPKRDALWKELDRALGLVNRRSVESGDPKAFITSVSRAFISMDELAEHLQSY